MTSARPGSTILASRLAGVVLVASVISGAALADPVLRQSDRVADLTFGLICPPPDGERRPAPDTLSGWVHVPQEPILRQADSRLVPAVLGIGFGVWFSLTDSDAVDLRYTITHPPMPPGGEMTQSWEVVIGPGNASSAFFQFDHPEEVQPGDWMISASSDGAEVFAVGFTVLPPRALPALADLCDQDTLLSFSPPSRAARG